MDQIVDEADSLDSLEDIPRLRELFDEKAKLFSDIFCLTPGEIREIVRREVRGGYIYWDSLVDIYPFLKLTFTLARRLEQKLTDEGGYTISGDSEEQMELREKCIKDLSYGGHDLTAKRSLVQRIRDRSQARYHEEKVGES